MDASQVLLHGTLNADGTLVLAETPCLPAGPVEVLIRVSPPASPGTESWWEFVQRSHAESIAQGERPRTKEEIDAERARVRALDAERQEENPHQRSVRE